MASDINSDLGVLTAEDWDAGRTALGNGTRYLLFGTSSKTLDSLVRQFRDAASINQPSINTEHDKEQPDNPERTEPRHIALYRGDSARLVGGPGFIKGADPMTKTDLSVALTAALEAARSAGRTTAAKLSPDPGEGRALLALVGDILIWRFGDDILINRVKDLRAHLEFSVDEFRQFANELKAGRFDEFFSTERTGQRPRP